jgi:hypothetical protein
MWLDTVGLAGLSTDRSGHATPTSTIMIVSGSQTRLRGAEFHQWTSYRRLKRLRMWSFQNGTGGCCRKTVGVTTNKRFGASQVDRNPCRPLAIKQYFPSKLECPLWSQFRTQLGHRAMSQMGQQRNSWPVNIWVVPELESEAVRPLLVEWQRTVRGEEKQVVPWWLECRMDSLEHPYVFEISL